MTDQEYVTIRTGSRTYATGVLMWRDAEKGTAVVQIGEPFSHREAHHLQRLQQVWRQWWPLHVNGGPDQ